MTEPSKKNPYMGTRARNMRDITRQIWGFKKPRWRSKTLEILD
jgi:hypothetical protein